MSPRCLSLSRICTASKNVIARTGLLRCTEVCFEARQNLSELASPPAQCQRGQWPLRSVCNHHHTTPQHHQPAAVRAFRAAGEVPRGIQGRHRAAMACLTGRVTRQLVFDVYQGEALFADLNPTLGEVPVKSYGSRGGSYHSLPTERSVTMAGESFSVADVAVRDTPACGRPLSAALTPTSLPPVRSGLQEPPCYLRCTLYQHHHPQGRWAKASDGGVT